MSQSRKKSFVEAVSNTASAFLLSWFIQAAIIPLLFSSVEATVIDAFAITCIYTFISIGRNYFIRRVFNESA